MVSPQRVLWLSQIGQVLLRPCTILAALCASCLLFLYLPNLARTFHERARDPLTRLKIRGGGSEDAVSYSILKVVDRVVSKEHLTGMEMGNGRLEGRATSSEVNGVTGGAPVTSPTTSSRVYDVTGGVPVTSSAGSEVTGGVSPDVDGERGDATITAQQKGDTVDSAEATRKNLGKPEGRRKEDKNKKGGVREVSDTNSETSSPTSTLTERKLDLNTTTQGATISSKELKASGPTTTTTNRLSVQASALKTVQKVPHSQKLLPTWSPRPGKYLLGYCFLNRWSNRLLCMEKAFIAAVLLNRTLIVPSLDVCSEKEEAKKAETLIDVQHLRGCVQHSSVWGGGEEQEEGVGVGKLGGESEQGQTSAESTTKRRLLEDFGSGKGVVSLEEYLLEHKVEKLRVDKLLCTKRGMNDFCPNSECNAYGSVELPRHHQRPPFNIYSDSFPLHKTDFAALKQAVGDPDVLCLGDTFYTNAEDYTITGSQTLVPMFNSSCGLLFQPSEEAFSQADEYIEKEMGGNLFAAIHFRRTDFQRHCHNSKCPYWSLEQTVHCLSTEMTKKGIGHLFLATDTGYTERVRLGHALWRLNISVHVFQPRNGWDIPKAEFKEWREEQYNHRTSFSPDDLVDKLIAAKSVQFFYQVDSTFSQHIRQLRGGMGMTKEEDMEICRGRDLSFVPPPTLVALRKHRRSRA